MSELTRYWRKKKSAIKELLDHSPGTSPEEQMVRTWFNTLKVMATGLQAELLTLDSLRGNITGPPADPQRRSARLVAMVQKAIKAGPNSSGFYASVADVTDDATQPAVADLAPYYTQVRLASESAANFLDHARSDPAGIADALETLLANASAGFSEGARLEIESLKDSLKAAAAKKGGSGEGSGYWPSSWVSSSSSGG